MKIGYARVSTQDQNPQLQIDALNEEGCDEIFVEKASGSSMEGRPQLAMALRALHRGDVLLVWKAERLARSTLDFATIVEDLRHRGIGFRSLTQPFDTTTPAGRLFMMMLAAFAQFERENSLERINAGIKAAQAAGVHCGRPRKVTPTMVHWARQMVYDEGWTLVEVAAVLGVSESTMSKRLGGLVKGAKAWYSSHPVPSGDFDMVQPDVPGP